MRVAVFLVYLCFLLMGGNNGIYAGLHRYSTCYDHTVHHGKKVKFTHGVEDDIMAQDTAPDTQEEYLDSDDSEDEDEAGNFLTTKEKLLCWYCAVFAHLLRPNDLHEYPKASPAQPGLAAPRYITQRALRI